LNWSGNGYSAAYGLNVYLVIFLTDEDIECPGAGSLNWSFFSHLLYQFASLSLGDKLTFPFYILEGLGFGLWRGGLQAVFPFKEAHAGGGIESIDEHVADVFGYALGGFFGFCHLRLESIGRTDGNRFAAALIPFEDCLLYLWVNWNWRLAV
jgi:hypothetical protein